MGGEANLPTVNFSLREFSFLFSVFMSGSFGFRHLLKQRIPRYLDVKQRTTGLQDHPPVMGHYDKHTAATPSETHVRKLLKLTAQALLAAAAGHPEHLLGRGG